MSRDQIVVAAFQQGIVSSADPTDAPTDAAIFSADVDPEAPYGVLRGRPGDLAVASSAQGMRSGAFLQRDDSTHDLIYHDERNNKFKSIQNYYTSPTNVADLANAVNNERTQIIPGTRAVRIARSGGDVQWVGYVDSEQFGDNGDLTTLRVEQAELVNHAGDPYFSKFIIYNDGAADIGYGIVRGDTKIYRIDGPDGARESTTFGDFTSIQAICRGFNQRSGKDILWALDLDGTLYSLYPIELDTDTVGVAIDISNSGWTIPTGGVVSDIVAAKNGVTGYDRIFLATHIPSAATKIIDSQFLLTVDATGAGPLSVTDRTPQMDDYGTATGNWVMADKNGYHALNFPTSGGDNLKKGMGVNETFPLSLVKLGDDFVGWMWRSGHVVENFLNGVGQTLSGSGPYYKGTGDVYHQANLCMAILPHTYTTSSLYPIIQLQAVAQGDMRVTGIAYDTATLNLAYSLGESVRRLALSAAPAAAVVGDVITATSITTRTFDWEPIVTGTYTSPTPDNFILPRSTGFAGVDALPISFTSTSNLVNYYEGGGVFIDIDGIGSTGAFTTGRRYFYKASIEYDGLQESPLSITSWRYDNVSTENHIVRIQVNPLNLSRRATGLNVYRAEGESTDDVAVGYYRRIKYLPFTRDVFGVTATNMQVGQFSDVNDIQGAAYEARTGIPETLDNTFVQYECAAFLNGELFVARCRHAELSDADHMIFKSRPFRFDTFDWSNQYLRLPEIPTAILPFNGRIYAFSFTNVYQINGEGMYVEMVYPGTGCFSQAAACTTDFGIMYCDRNNVYLVNEKGVQFVGDPIRQSDWDPALCWEGLQHNSFTPRMVYSSALKQIHIVAQANADNLRSFCFHVPGRRWDMWTIPCDTTLLATYPEAASPLTGKNGELIWVDPVQLYNMASQDASRKGYMWVSKKYHGDTPSQIKKWYIIRVTSSGGNPTTIIKQVAIDGVWANMSSELIEDVSTILGKTLQFLLSVPANAGDDVIIKDVSVLYRRLVGLR